MSDSITTYSLLITFLLSCIALYKALKITPKEIKVVDVELSTKYSDLAEKSLVRANELREINDRLEKEIDEFEDQIATAKLQIKELEATIKELNKRIEVLEARIVYLESVIKNLEDKIAELKKNLPK